MKKSNLISFSLFASFCLLAAPVIAAPATDLPVRVQLKAQNTHSHLEVSATSTVKALTSIGWQDIGHLPPGTGLDVSAQAGQIKLANQNGKLYQALKIEVPNADARIQTNQKWYRGNLMLKGGKQGFSVVNEVPLEQYLYSVVPSEMPASWPGEALKAQAVAARTYALTHLGRYRKYGFDVNADTSSQVYQGIQSEHPQSTAAVRSTQSEIMTHQGKPIDAYFHSTSGGRTENGGDLWAPRAYLQMVEDLDQASPKYTWQEEISQEVMRVRLRTGLNINAGKIIAIRPTAHTRSGRVKSLEIQADNGTHTVDGLKFRVAAKLNSTFFNVGGIGSSGNLLQGNSETPVSFQFAGRGWGHGLGMSQWGARQMALNGHRYDSILSHYYRGINMEKINPSRYQLALIP